MQSGSEVELLIFYYKTVQSGKDVTFSDQMKQHTIQKILRKEGIFKKSKMIFITPYRTVLAELESSFITTENTI